MRTDRWWGVFCKVRGIRGHKGVGRGWVAMELLKESFLSPEFVPLFKKGDLVHVFEGTGSGQVKMRSVGWFGRVLGMKEGKYMVRNRILNSGRERVACIDRRRVPYVAERLWAWDGE